MCSDGNVFRKKKSVKYQEKHMWWNTFLAFYAKNELHHNRFFSIMRRTHISSNTFLADAFGVTWSVTVWQQKYSFTSYHIHYHNNTIRSRNKVKVKWNRWKVRPFLSIFFRFAFHININSCHICLCLHVTKRKEQGVRPIRKP